MDLFAKRKRGVKPFLTCLLRAMHLPVLLYFAENFSRLVHAFSVFVRMPSKLQFPEILPELWSVIKQVEYILFNLLNPSLYPGCLCALFGAVLCCCVFLLFCICLFVLLWVCVYVFFNFRNFLGALSRTLGGLWASLGHLLRTRGLLIA